MARRSAALATETIAAAIPRLKLRMEELQAFEPKSVTYRNDPRIGALDKKLEDTIASIFGSDTEEFSRFRPRDLDSAGYNTMYGTPFSEVIAGLQVGKERELLNLKTIIELFEEQLQLCAATPAARSRRAFEDLELHSEIRIAAQDLFANGHYTEAVEAACKALELLVKMRSLRADPSGTELMQLVFSPKAPILRFSDQSNESEKSEQQGMMFLFSGAMLAIRNPRAHGMIADHPENAVDCISFLSMLAKSLDRAKKHHENDA